MSEGLSVLAMQWTEYAIPLMTDGNFFWRRITDCSFQEINFFFLYIFFHICSSKCQFIQNPFARIAAPTGLSTSLILTFFFSGLQQVEELILTSVLLYLNLKIAQLHPTLVIQSYFTHLKDQSVWVKVSFLTKIKSTSA